MGGESISFAQIADLPDSYILADNIEFPIGKKLPIWLLGLIYWVWAAISPYVSLRADCRIDLCGVDGLLALARIAADAKHHAEIGAGDEGGRAASTDERQGLARDGEEADGNEHVEEGLRNKEQRKPHHKKGWEVALASPGNDARSEQ